MRKTSVARHSWTTDRGRWGQHEPRVTANWFGVAASMRLSVEVHQILLRVY